MASSIIEVNTNTLKSNMETMQGHIHGLRKSAESLRNISGQLDNMWDGEAKQAFVTAVRDDLNRLETLISAMEKYTGKTDEARGEYDRCESAVSQIVSSIRV